MLSRGVLFNLECVFPLSLSQQGPESGTTFYLVTFFGADLVQSEVTWKKNSLVSEWMMTMSKNVNGIKAVALLSLNDVINDRD